MRLQEHLPRNKWMRNPCSNDGQRLFDHERRSDLIQLGNVCCILREFEVKGLRIRPACYILSSEDIRQTSVSNDPTESGPDSRPTKQPSEDWLFVFADQSTLPRAWKTRCAINSTRFEYGRGSQFISRCGVERRKRPVDCAAELLTGQRDLEGW